MNRCRYKLTSGIKCGHLRIFDVNSYDIFHIKIYDFQIANYGNRTIDLDINLYSKLNVTNHKI